MKRNVVVLLAFVISICLSGCVANTPKTDTSTVQPSPSPSAEKPKVESSAHSQVTLPVLDALLANEDFVTELKTKVQLTNDQVEGLKKIARTEVDRLRSINAEQSEANTIDGGSGA